METQNEGISVTVGYIFIDPDEGLLAFLRLQDLASYPYKRELGGEPLQRGEGVTDGVTRTIKQQTDLEDAHYELYELGYRELIDTDQDGQIDHTICFQYLAVAKNTSRLKNKNTDIYKDIQFFQPNNLPDKEQTTPQFYPTLLEFADAIKAITSMNFELHMDM